MPSPGIEEWLSLVYQVCCLIRSGYWRSHGREEAFLELQWCSAVEVHMTIQLLHFSRVSSCCSSRMRIKISDHEEALQDAPDRRGKLATGHFECSHDCRSGMYAVGVHCFQNDSVRKADDSGSLLDVGRITRTLRRSTGITSVSCNCKPLYLVWRRSSTTSACE